MLEEVESARNRLNGNRAKPLNFDCKYYFVDVEAAHTEHLRRVLAERGYQVESGDIVVRNSRFEDAADAIISEIGRRQPRAGRFDFPSGSNRFLAGGVGAGGPEFFGSCRKRRSSSRLLPMALVNHLAVTPALIKAVGPLALTESQIRDLIQYRGGAGGQSAGTKNAA